MLSVNKKKRKRACKKKEDRELIHFLDYEQDELPLELRSIKSFGFEILSVENYNASDIRNKVQIPIPIKSTAKSKPKNTALPLRKNEWKNKKKTKTKK